MNHDVSYQSTIDFLYSLEFFGIKLGLANIERLLELCHQPQQQQNFIQIAGSNGKGSVAAMLEAILLAAGKTTGLFTSPHLVEFTERIRINQQDISRSLLSELTNGLRPFIKQVAEEEELEHPTYFEVSTVLALLAFARHKVDWSILEVGMGGRLDATSSVTPRAQIITNISLEHQEYLGDTIEKVAAEKAGAIKPGVPVFTRATGPALEVIRDTCFKLGSPCCYGAELGQITKNQAGVQGQLVSLRTPQGQYDDLLLPLFGRHQAENALLAVRVAESLVDQLDQETVKDGLGRTFWPGRIMVLDQEPLTILDGAHNLDSAEKLFTTLRESFQYQRLILVLAVLKDKNVHDIISPIPQQADTIIATEVKNTGRSLSADRLAALLKEHGQAALVIDSSADAVAQARRLAGPGDLVLIYGSLYLVGEVLGLQQYAQRRTR